MSVIRITMTMNGKKEALA